MTTSRRAQVMLEPEEYDALVSLAEAQGSTVSALIRHAVRETWLSSRIGRPTIVAELLAMREPIFEDPQELGALIAEARLAELS